MASLVESSPVVAAPWLANFAMFAGAVCFSIGAYLLIPELFEEKIDREELLRGSQ